ncbi:MAG: hypothetical protein RL223_3702 [Pseudomonadota bacterium]|jgi:outer membrane protein OmpA-like peptidoglycan-associated protein
MSNSQDDKDNNERIGLWIALGAAALVVGSVVGGAVWHRLSAKADGAAAAPAAVEASAPAAAVATAAAVAVEMIDVPLAGEVTGTVFYEVGGATLPAEGPAEIAAALRALQAAAGKKLVISGFHDASGDPAKNAELAKQRAIGVRDALLAAGAPAEAVALRKPESTTGGADPRAARRVEIRLVD